MKNKPENVLVIVLAILLLTGCADHPPRPVVVQQHGDAERSCDELEQALDQIVSEISERLSRTGPAGTTNRLDVTDFFLLEPARYRALDKAGQDEVDALVKRYNHLIDIGRVKGCECERQRLPEFGQTGY